MNKRHGRYWIKHKSSLFNTRPGRRAFQGTKCGKFPAVEEYLFKYVRDLRATGIAVPWHLASPSIVAKSFKKMGLSNALDRTEDDALWEGADSGRGDDSQSDFSTIDSD